MHGVCILHVCFVEIPVKALWCLFSTVPLERVMILPNPPLLFVLSTHASEIVLYNAWVCFCRLPSRIKLIFNYIIVTTIMSLFIYMSACVMHGRLMVCCEYAGFLFLVPGISHWGTVGREIKPCQQFLLPSL